MCGLICSNSVVFCISSMVFLIGETYVKEYRVCVMLGCMKIQKIISRMEKSGSTIMHHMQQSLFHKHAECFVLYSTSHSSYFLTLARIVFVKRKNISWQCASLYQDQHQIPIKAILCSVVCWFVLNLCHQVCSFNPEDQRFCGKFMWIRLLEFTKIMSTNF